MPVLKRIKTKYPGVYYIKGASLSRKGKPERIYYIRYRKNGKEIEEKAGSQLKDAMTPEMAATIRRECILGTRLSRKELRMKEIHNSNSQLQVGNEYNHNFSANEKWHLFMNSATEGFAIYDSDLKLIEINDAGMMKILPSGLRKEDIIGKHLIEFVPFTKESNEYKSLAKVIKTGVPLSADDVIITTEPGESRHFKIKAFRVGDGLGIIAFDITKTKRQEEELRKKEVELESANEELHTMNAGMKILLKKLKEDKLEAEDKVLLSVKKLVRPHLEQLKETVLTSKQSALVSIIEESLNEILSPFNKGFMSQLSDLTPTELQVANLVKQGKTTKEIASVYNLSTKTIDFHRASIRKKIGLSNRKKNLRSYLLSH